MFFHQKLNLERCRSYCIFFVNNEDFIGTEKLPFVTTNWFLHLSFLREFQGVIWRQCKFHRYMIIYFKNEDILYVQSVAEKTSPIEETVSLDFGFWYLSMGRESSKPIIKWIDKLEISYKLYCMFQFEFKNGSEST